MWQDRTEALVFPKSEGEGGAFCERSSLCARVSTHSLLYAQQIITIIPH